MHGLPGWTNPGLGPGSTLQAGPARPRSRAPQEDPRGGWRRRGQSGEPGPHPRGRRRGSHPRPGLRGLTSPSPGAAAAGARAAAAGAAATAAVAASTFGIPARGHGALHRGRRGPEGLSRSPGTRGRGDRDGGRREGGAGRGSLSSDSASAPPAAPPRTFTRVPAARAQPSSAPSLCLLPRRERAARPLGPAPGLAPPTER